jgi:hypothetical protein
MFYNLFVGCARVTHQTNKHRMIEQTLEVTQQNKNMVEQQLEVEEDGEGMTEQTLKMTE